MHDLSTSPTAAVREKDGSWLVFRDPVAVVAVSGTGDVLPGLRKVEDYLQRGLYAAGYISYEASTAFDDSFHTFLPDSLPLIWFGIFSEPHPVPGLPTGEWSDEYEFEWKPDVTQKEYEDAVARIKEYIAAGDSYQVNYTFRLTSPFKGNPWDYFRTVVNGHPMPYAAFIDTGRHAICSFSPELFFSLENGDISVQPMKGTARRGRFPEEDVMLRRELVSSVKERAENVMIVDMVRNDIGRIAQPGTVHVSELCGLRTFHTVFQMVSTVHGRVACNLSDVFASLFPCASISGAPKVRTTQIIREIEKAPRHVYCGSIGWAAPHRRALFNIAIRTLLIDIKKKRAEYGTGSGIVWDSDTAGEYEECRLKTSIITKPQHDFLLVETLLWTVSEGYYLMNRHVERLEASADYFGFTFDVKHVAAALKNAVGIPGSAIRRVRLTLARNGECRFDVSDMPHEAEGTKSELDLFLYPGRISSRDVFIFHKTNRRRQYAIAREQYPHGDDLLFMNEKDELTETTIGNIVFSMGGKLYTPPIRCGLLPGVFRQMLVEEKKINERVLHVSDLEKTRIIFRINSVRKWQKCILHRPDAVDSGSRKASGA